MKKKKPSPRVRPLQKRWNPSAPFRVVRTDFDDGSISYEIWDERPDTYHRLCSTYEQDELDRGAARRDADMIVKALNLLYQLEHPSDETSIFLPPRNPQEP